MKQSKISFCAHRYVKVLEKATCVVNAAFVMAAFGNRFSQTALPNVQIGRNVDGVQRRRYDCASRARRYHLEKKIESEKAKQGNKKITCNFCMQPFSSRSTCPFLYGIFHCTRCSLLFGMRPLASLSANIRGVLTETVSRQSST